MKSKGQKPTAQAVALLLVAIVGLTTLASACTNPVEQGTTATTLASSKAITAFALTSPTAVGAISEAGYTISLTVPFGTNVSALVPVFSNTGASVSPPLGTVQNFNSPVTYTVTAQDGSSQAYVVTVLQEPFLALVSVPAGRFQRDYTPSNVSSVSAFKIGRYHVTRAQFWAVLRADPSRTLVSSSSSDPVDSVNWYHAIAFCNKFSIQEGLTQAYSVSGIDFSTLNFSSVPLVNDATWNAATFNSSATGYRLPTEAEWTWAAMGAPIDGQGNGTNTTAHIKGYAGSTEAEGVQNNIDSYAWYYQNSSGTSSPVGTKLPNELGLYDMTGNVYQWVWDWYASNPSGPIINPQGAASGLNRVLRGGSFNTFPYGCYVTSREYFGPYLQYNYVGFRVVRP